MCQESELTPQSRLEVAISRYQTLFEMAHTLAHQGALPNLLRELHARLKNVDLFDLINFCLYDESQNDMLLDIWQGPDSPVLPMHMELDQSLAGWVWQNQKPMVWS